MEKGDLSNRLPPRWLVVFEGVIGVLPTEVQQARFDFCMKIRRPKLAVRAFEPDEYAVKRLWDMTWRQDYKFDAVTFLPDKAVMAVREWLDTNNVPAVNLLAFTEPAGLARRLAFMPDVQAVVHADEAHRFTYGDRGLLVRGNWTV